MSTQVIEIKAGERVIIKSVEGTLTIQHKPVREVEPVMLMPLPEIKRIVEKHTGVDLAGKLRHRHRVIARHAYCYIAHKVYEYSLKDVGELINRDHTTVINSHRQFDNLMCTNDKYTVAVWKDLKTHFPTNIDPRTR